jgi:hypothetical protein
MVVKKLGLAGETSDAIRALVDDLGLEMVNDLRSFLSNAEA